MASVMKGLNENVYGFSVIYNSIYKPDILKILFSLIKQVFIVLLGFSISLATKCMFLNDEPCMGRPTLVGLNPVEHKYYWLV